MLPLPFLEKRFTFFIAWMTAAMFLGNDMFLPSINNLAGDLSVSVSMVQTAITWWVIGMGVSQIFWGPLTDRLGRRPTLIAGGIIFAIATFVCSLTPSMAVFLIARFFEGVGVCTVFIAALPTINDYYEDEPKKAISALALTSNLFLLAPLLGPLAGAFLADHIGWRGVFFLDALFCVLGSFFIFLSFPETLSAQKRAQRTSIVEAFKEHFRNKAFILYSMSVSLGSTFIILWVSGASIFFMNKLHFSEKGYVVAQIPVFAALLVGNTLGPFAIRFASQRRIITLMHKSILYVVPLTILIPLLQPQNFIFYEIPLCLTLLLMGISNGVKYRFCMSLPQRNQGMAAGILSLFQSVGAILGSVVALGVLPFPLWFFSLSFAFVSILIVVTQIAGDFFAPEVS